MDAATIQRRRWGILAVLVLSLLVVVMDTSILNVALQTIADPARGLGANQSQLEWATDSYTLAFAGLLFTTGILGDRYGRKWMLLGGMALFGLGSVAAAYSQSPDQLILFRAVMGLGGAAIMPSTLSILTNVFEPRERGKAIGIWAGAVGVAVALGPITGGLLLEHFWWGSVFLINVPFVIVALVLMALLVPNSRNPKPGRLDPLGVVLSIVALTTVVFGVIRGGDLNDWGSPQVWGTILGGLLVGAVFLWWERRIDHPALNVTLFRNAGFSAAIGVVALVFLALTGVTFFMSFYFQSVRGYSALETGACLLPFAVGQIVSSSRSAKFVERFGPRAVCSAGMLLVTASFSLYLFVTPDFPLWVLLLGFFVQGLGMGNVMPPATNAVMGSVPREQAGEGSAINNTMRQVGGALGIAVIGTVLTSAYSGKISPALDKVPGLSAGVKHQLSQSVASTMGFVHDAKAAHPQVAALVEPARHGFVHAVHMASIVSVAICFVGLLVSVIWMPRTAANHGGGPGAPSAPQPSTGAKPEAAPAAQAESAA